MIFNRDAVVAFAMMMAVAIAFLALMVATDTTKAQATCQQTRSTDVCSKSIQP